MHPRKYSFRSSCVFLVLIFLLFLFVLKLLLIQVFNSSYLADLAKKQHNHLIKLEPKRGTIYDRNLRPLAINLPVYSLFANPKIMTSKDKSRAVLEISVLLHVSASFIEDRLSKGKYFVWLMRKVPQSVYTQIKDLKIHGLGFVKESKRFYPNKFLAAHVIGFAGIDNNGLEGLELQYDHYLKGKEGFAQILRDARQRELLIEKNYSAPQNGFHLVLTIDETIQFIAERALEKGFQKHNAQGATIIVMNPKTGEILAFANRPTYNLEEPSQSNPVNRTNRALAFTYEPGSVFKIVTAAAALQEGVVKESDIIFCENGSYKVGNHILHDHHAEGHLTFQEVIEQSSNIGTTKIAQRLGPQRVYDYAKRFRFGIKTGVDLLGESAGNLKPVSRWSKTSIGAVPIGQEVTVTPLQLVAAISAIANNGIYMKPYVVQYVKDDRDEIIQSFAPQVVDKIITDETDKRLKEILRGVVDRGTATKAQIKGVTVAGKTGTAQKVVGGTYSHNKFYATFIGFAPVEDPKLACVVVFDEPHPSYYGGTVAAPVFQEVIEDSLKYLSALGN